MRRIIALFTLILTLTLAACGGSSSTSTAPTQAQSSSGTCVPYSNGNGPFTYVALGASDAVGWGATCADRDGYVPRLGQRMPANTKVVNLGIAGYKLNQALQSELPNALAAKPNIVTVWLVGNDFKSTLEQGTPTLTDYTQQLDTLLKTLKTQTTAHVYVGNLPDMTLLPIFKNSALAPDIIASQNAAWNAAIATEVNQYGFTLVDLYHSDLASHPEYIFADGFHPNSLGYLRLADLFWAAIQQTHGTTTP